MTILVMVAQPFMSASKSELGPKLEQQSSPFPGGQRLVDSLGNAFPMDGDAEAQPNPKRQGRTPFVRSLLTFLMLPSPQTLWMTKTPLVQMISLECSL